ncbi:MAG: hypothetical protein CM1200mP41_28550 [Gammaproteobacteria bacterium]|nr:MAG: hypothetical protein CM1200mP41_28550 [Gammaproteobacteria bacterium]
MAAARPYAARSNNAFLLNPGVIIADSRAAHGATALPAWRWAPLASPALMDLRGQPDLEGRPLAVSLTGFADQIASAAQLLMGKAPRDNRLCGSKVLSWQCEKKRCARSDSPAGTGFVPLTSMAGVLALSGGGGRREARAGPSIHPTRRPLTVICNTGETLNIWACRSHPTSIPCSTPSPASKISRDGLGTRQRDLDIHGKRWPASAGDTWFRLGDADLAVHIERTRRRARPVTLYPSSPKHLRSHLGIQSTVFANVGINPYVPRV